MNKYLAYIIDDLSLMDLHRNKSRVSQFDYDIAPHESKYDLDTFYFTPKTPSLTFTQTNSSDKYSIGTYKYLSEIDNNDDSNKYSTGSYYKCMSGQKKTSVILVHGWRMDSFNRINNIYLKKFMDQCYDIYTFTLPHHFSRSSSNSLYEGEFMVSANIGRTLLSVKQAVSDLRALICYLKEQNEKVILIGVSLGGFITNLTSVIETNVDMLISVMYANSIAFSVWNSIPGKYIKKDLVSNSFTYEKLKEEWFMTDPSNFKPAIPKDNILLISGSYDRYVLGEDTDSLWEKWDKPQRKIYPCGHAGIVFMKDQIRDDSMKFIRERLGI